MVVWPRSPAWSASTNMPTTSSGRPLHATNEFFLPLISWQGWDQKATLSLSSLTPLHPLHCGNPGPSSWPNFSGRECSDETLLWMLQLTFKMSQWMCLLKKSTSDSKLKMIQPYPRHRAPPRPEDIEELHHQSQAGPCLHHHLLHNQLWVGTSTVWPKKDECKKPCRNSHYCNSHVKQLNSTIGRTLDIGQTQVFTWAGTGDPSIALQLWKFLGCQICTLSTHSCLKVSLSFPWVAAYSYYNEAFPVLMHESSKSHIDDIPN